MQRRAQVRLIYAACLLLTDAAEKSSGSTLVKQLCSEKEAVMYLGVHVARA